MYADTVRSPGAPPRGPARRARPVPLRRGGRRPPHRRSARWRSRCSELGTRPLHPLEEFGSTSCRGRDDVRGAPPTRFPCGRCRRSGSSGRSCRRLPAVARRPAARGGRRAHARPRALRRAAGASRRAAELAGIRRAQRAAEAAMDAARDLLRRSQPERRRASTRRRAAHSRAGEGGDAAGVRRRTARAATTSSSRTGRRRRSATTSASGAGARRRADRDRHLAARRRDRPAPPT